MTIVGFHGQLGSGKDTAAERMAQMVKLPHVRIAFADKLKASAAALFDVDPELWNEWKNDPDVVVYLTDGYREINSDYGNLQEPNVIAELNARQFLQRFGTEAHREIFGYDFWVDQALKEIDGKVFPNPILVTITDVRFENEFEAIKNRGGVVIHVVGPQAEATHASEQPLEGATYTVDNVVRHDDFRFLDEQLYAIVQAMNLPLQEV